MNRVVALKEIPEELLHPQRAWTALGNVITHLGEVPTEDYLHRRHPELARAIEHHGGIDSMVLDNAHELKLLLSMSDERHETSILHWKKAMDGEEHSKDKLAALYRPLAEKIAGRLYSRKLRSTWNEWVSVEKEDLVQEGLVSLMKKLPDYDPARSKFPRFAHVTMEGAMMHYLRDNVQIIREPAWVQELRSKLSNAFADYQSKHGGRKPSFAELARHAKVPIEHVIEGFTHYQPVSLQATFDFEGKGREEHSFAEPAARDELEPIALKLIFYKAMRQHVKLSKTQAIALGMSAGGHSLEEIAERLGVSPAAAGQSVYQAKKKIRENLLFKHELGID